MKRGLLYWKKHRIMGAAAGLFSIVCLCMAVYLVTARLNEEGYIRSMARGRLPGVLEEIAGQSDTAYKYKTDYHAEISGFLLEDGSSTSIEFASNNLLFWLNCDSLEMKFSGENVVQYTPDSRDVYHYTCYFVPKRDGIVKYTRRYNANSDDITRTWDWDMETCAGHSTQEIFSGMAGGSWKSGQRNINNTSFFTYKRKIPNVFGRFKEFDFCQDIKELELTLYIRKSDGMPCMAELTLPDGKTQEEVAYCGQPCTLQEFRFQFRLYDKDVAFQVGEDISGVNLGLDKKK